MAKPAPRKKGVSWELIGVFVLLAIFLVGGLIWATAEKPTTAPAFSSESAADVAGVGDTIPSGVTADGKPYLGYPQATVTITEFADFQCPHCKAYTMESASEIKKNYVANGKAKIVFMNFAVLGDESLTAAKAAVCATEQGKFWKMHDYLYANQPAISNQGAFNQDNLLAIGEKVGLDKKKMETCMNNEATAKRVQAEKDFGVSKSVDATPSFLIGDVKVAGGDVAKIREALDHALGN